MIEILNENLKKIDILRKYTFAQYTRKFREIGTFQINVRLEKENLYLLEKDKEYYVLFDSKIFGKIEDVKKESDSEYERTIVLSGRLSNVLFTKRVVAGTINFKGNTAQFVKSVIENEITKDKESKRYVNIDVRYENEKYLESFCSLIDKQVTGGYVWNIIQPSLEQDMLGIYFNPIVEMEHTLQDGTETNISKWSLLISAGKDKRKGNTQGNKPVIFSQSLSNIARTDYELSLKEYRNVAYVAGEGEENKRKWYEVYPKEEEKKGNINASGWKRSELWIDARDIQSENADGNSITEEEYEKLIKQRAGEKFSENTKQETYTGTLTEANKQYTYGSDYDLGDIVTIIDNELGIVLDVQITDVVVTLQGNKQLVDIVFTYGKVNREPVGKLEDMNEWINQNINSVKYLETKINNVTKVADYIVEERHSSNGGYRKWASGILEQWLERSKVRWSIPNKYGTLYQGLYTWTYPVPFVEVPDFVICSKAQWGTGASWGTLYSKNTTEATFRAFDVVSRGNEYEMYFEVYAIGKWK